VQPQIFAGLVVFAVACLPVAVRAAAPKKAEKADVGRVAVDKVLRAEIAGQVDRREQLTAALKESPDSPWVRWQAGFVRDETGWRAFDDIPENEAAATIHREYLEQRRSAPATFAGQLALANWCHRRKLFDQERAHLFGAVCLASGSESESLWPRLGYRQIGGMWLSPEQLIQWLRLNRRVEESLKTWESKLNAIVKSVDASTSLQDKRTLSRLKEITDPAAIPAIELVLAGRGEGLALAAVDMFGRIDGPDATVALARQGLFSEWPSVRQAASTSLKQRGHFEDYVPAVISLLATPVRGEWRVTTNFRTYLFHGPVVLYFSYVLARETNQQFQVANFQSTNYRLNDSVNGLFVIGEEYRANRGTSSNPLDRGLAIGALEVGRQEAVKQKVLDDFNQRTGQLNEELGKFLVGVTGQPPSSEPKTWWDWWRTFSDTEPVGSKQIVLAYEDEVVGNPYSRGYTIISCFAAGTPVWTDQGLVAIEKVAVGDRVLSKDVESGELTYKPVLQTTVRPPKELMTLRLDDAAIVCTGGHRFWISGEGWVMARDLTSQAFLHTATGNTSVWSTRKGESAETYNLVVADFHTYFVGNTGVLCQDLLLPAATNNIVPGLSRSNIAARNQK
jgi:hypothetical protein